MLKMDEIDQTKLPDQTKFRLNEMRKIENYFREEINQRKLCSKKVNKYVIAFKHRQNFNCFKCNNWRICIIFHASVVRAPVGIASAGFTILFFLAIAVTKKLLKTTRNKKKKHDKNLMLAKSKLNSIESLVSQALIDMEIRNKS